MFNDFLEERAASVFRIEEFKLDDSRYMFVNSVVDRDDRYIEHPVSELATRNVKKGT
jgi:hypothetical protein